MIIIRRIKNWKSYIKSIKDKDYFFIAMCINDDNLKIVEQLGVDESGYTVPLIDGKRFLLENVQGEKHIDKNTMEPYFRDIHWVTKDYQGYIHEGIATYTAYRYRRLYDKPLDLKITVIKNSNGDKLLISEKLVNADEDASRICLYLNIFKEVFGSFIVLNDEFDFLPNVKKINWTILRPGESLNEYVKRIQCKQIRSPHKHMRSFSTFTEAKEVETYVGLQSFQGYVAFVYKNYDFVALESLLFDNATYIIRKDNWQEITKLTKSEVLNSDYIIKRVIHNNEWINNINSLYKQN